MLLEIFKSIILTSAVGSILIILLLFLKPMTKRCFGSKWQYYIWAVVLVVMILPVTIKLPQPAPITAGIIPAQQQGETILQNKISEAEQDVMQSTTEFNPYTHIINIAKDLWLGITDTACYIWFTGFVLIFAMNMFRYLIFLHNIRKNSVVTTYPEIGTKRIVTRKTKMIDAPLMIGLFKTTLLLPNYELSEENLKYILMHELTHYRRRDILYKWIAMLVNTVHWFNPLSYIVSIQIEDECEISCDLSVIANMSEQEQTCYMSTILSLVTQASTKHRLLTTAMASNKENLKTRFAMIRKNYKIGKVLSTFSAVAAIAILSTSVFASGILNDIAKNVHRGELSPENLAYQQDNINDEKNTSVISDNNLEEQADMADGDLPQQNGDNSEVVDLPIGASAPKPTVASTTSPTVSPTHQPTETSTAVPTPKPVTNDTPVEQALKMISKIKCMVNQLSPGTNMEIMLGKLQQNNTPYATINNEGSYDVQAGSNGKITLYSKSDTNEGLSVYLIDKESGKILINAVAPTRAYTSFSITGMTAGAVYEIKIQKNNHDSQSVTIIY